MNVQDIVDRLNAHCPLLDNRARRLRDITEIEDVDQGVPVAFVMRVADQTSEQNGIGPLVHQQRTRQIAVLMMTDADGMDAEPMEQLRPQIIAALLTWDDDPEIQFEYAGGEARPPIAGMDRWQDTFRYTDHIRFQLS